MKFLKKAQYTLSRLILIESKIIFYSGALLSAGLASLPALFDSDYRKVWNNTINKAKVEYEAK